MALQHVIDRGSQPSSLTQGSSGIGHSDGQRGQSYNLVSNQVGVADRIRDGKQHGNNIKKMVVAYNGSLD